MNSAMVESIATGRPMDNIVPLKTVLKSSLPHATDNPKTLLTYTAAHDNISKLHWTTFLTYGIPRVKMQTRRVLNFAEPIPDYDE